jgi:hypothetical protein
MIEICFSVSLMLRMVVVTFYPSFYSVSVLGELGYENAISEFFLMWYLVYLV